ncbi:MAG: NTP transferase domain-containing protein [Prevotella sp.]|nr:NTP transferase domain-containing protein [Prevotella sp.]
MKQAMILAAGLGTRLKPLTDTMPKALVPVGGHTLLDINIARLQQAGYGRFVVNVHHFAQQIIEHVKAHYPQNCPIDPLLSVPSPRILFSDETEQLLETGGGLKKARTLFSGDEPILIHNVDVLDNVDYDWFYRQHRMDEDAVLLVSKRKTKRYLLFDHAMRLMGWKNIETGEVKSPFPWLRTAEFTIDDNLNVKAAEDSQLFAQHSSLYAFAFSGIHSFSPRLFPLMERFPDRFGIIDFYLSVCHRAHIVGLAKNNLRMLDVGKLDSLEEASRFVETSDWHLPPA